MFTTTTLLLKISITGFQKSELINLQMLIQANTFNVLSSCCPLKKTCTAISASVSLAQTPFWHMQKPGIQSCENVPHVQRPFDLLQLLYFHLRVNTFKTPEMCLYLDSDVSAGCFTIIFVGSYHYFKLFSCWILFCENVPGIP